jgi:site-specific recombinase XerD
MRRAEIEAWSDLRALNESFTRALHAENRAPRTLALYTGAVKRFVAFLEERGMPTTVDAIEREHVESYIAHLVETRAANTAASEYRALRRFFGWLVDEGEIARSPMERMRAAVTPEVPVPVLSDEQMRRLLKACEGTGLEGRRDTAMIQLLIDSGMRWPSSWASDQ